MLAMVSVIFIRPDQPTDADARAIVMFVLVNGPEVPIHRIFVVIERLRPNHSMVVDAAWELVTSRRNVRDFHRNVESCVFVFLRLGPLKNLERWDFIRSLIVVI